MKQIGLGGAPGRAGAKVLKRCSKPHLVDEYRRWYFSSICVYVIVGSIHTHDRNPEKLTSTFGTVRRLKLRGPISLFQKGG